MADTNNNTGADSKSSAADGISAEDIADAASNPSSFSVDGLTQSNRPLVELIAADKYLRKRRLAARQNPLSCLVSRTVAGGCF